MMSINVKAGLFALSIALVVASGVSVVAAQPPVGMPADANIFVNLAKKIVPSVVNISSLSKAKNPFSQGSPDDFLRKFFEDFMRRHGQGDVEDEDDVPALPRGPRQRPQALSLGTGFIIDSSGLILTNNHVVAGADEIKITFTEEADEKPTDAEVVGRDTELDVALIKVKSKRAMVPVVLGDSDSLQVGEYVIAVGNPFGQGHSVTHGIISAKGRVAPDFPLANYLQTDAPINPGNSGGPLVNLKGEVVGINNAIDQRAQGIGFAIPVNPVKKVLAQLREKGSVTRGYIGVLVGEMTPELASQLKVKKDLRAPFVTHVFPGQPADLAGMKPYDVILEFNGRPVHSSAELINAVTSVNVGDAAAVKLLRDGKELKLSIQVTQRPGAKELVQDRGRKKKKDKKPAKIDVGMVLEDLSSESRKDLNLPEKTGGAVVSSVAYGGPADKAGLIRGDVILEVDRQSVKDVEGFYSIVMEKKSYLLRVRRSDPRGNESFTVIVLDLKG